MSTLCRPRLAMTMVLAASCFWATDVSADAGNRYLAVGQAIGYGSAVMTGVVAGSANGIACAYAEETPAVWRIVGFVGGGVDVVLGTGLLLRDSSDVDSLIVGLVPLVVGATAIVTAAYAPVEDTPTSFRRAMLSPMVTPGGGGVLWSGSF